MTSWVKANVGSLVTWALLILGATAALAFRTAELDHVGVQADANTSAIQIVAEEVEEVSDDLRSVRESVRGLPGDVRANREALIRIETKLGTLPAAGVK